jgi:aryl-alcohol dehydrogenase-like predicted oxidoreductase
MQLTGEGVWGPPRDHHEAIAVLRRAVELGVTLFDTADSYGPYVAEDLLSEALHPYGDDVVLATKAGLVRTGPGEWWPVGRPEYLRQECEMSLRRLGVERIGLYQLHRIDPQIPIEDQVGVLRDQLRSAQAVATIATVQNRYNLVDRASEELVDLCDAEGIGFIPWFPIATGELAKEGGPLDELAGETGASPAQLALAWLLRRSPVVLPIPGTSSVAHLDENIAAALVALTDAEVEALTASS